MKKTKIIEIIESLSDGGAQSIVKDYATLIDKEKFDIVIFTIYPCTYSANYKQVEASGVEVFSVYENYNFFSKIINRVFKKQYITRKLRSFLLSYRPNVIHVHSVMLKYLAPSSSIIKGCNVFYTCHSLPHRYFGEGHKDESKAAKVLIKNNKMCFIGLHEKMRVELNKIFNVNNTIVLKNGVDFSRFSNINESKAEIRHSIGIEEDSFLIGHVGRFADMKNQTFLVDVFRIVSKYKVNARLLLIGDGELLGDIKAKVEKLGLQQKVFFLSHRTDIPRLLKAMDVFVFPSIYEGLPVSIVESQIAGVRTITSDNVTNECFYKPLLIPLKLSYGADVWAKTILDTSITGPYDRDIKEFDMSEVVKKLEKMYKN